MLYLKGKSGESYNIGSGVNIKNVDLVKKLEFFRQKDQSLVDISFNTICATGSNGAITHYRVTDKSNKKIGKNELILIDSGGQYEEGTTDITRTLINGKPNKKNKLLNSTVNFIFILSLIHI